MLSKSRFTLAVQCKKQLYLNDTHPEEKEDIVNDAVFENGNEVGELAKKLFGEYIDIKFNKNLKQMIIDTNNALNNKKANICEASFSFENNFCSVDILKKDNDNYEIYEVKSSTELKDIYVYDAAYQYYVLTSLGMNVNKVSIVHINSDYERIGNLDINKLFTIEDITSIVKSINVKDFINEINEYMENPKDIDIGSHCTKPYECPFFKYCTKNLIKPNIFDVKRLSFNKKIDYYNKGIISYEDLKKEKLPSYCLDQINRIDEILNIDKVKDFLSTLKEPLYFLDFETYQDSIPNYDYQKPYMQMPFQYSLHYIENGKLYHKEFLSEDSIDPRRLLAESLVNDIPLNSCTLAYNMMFEKMVIKNLANIYPDLRTHLLNIHDNMKDLMIPFKNHDVYLKQMEGSYSIKYVLPSLFPDDPSLNYHNLELVHNGSEAMNIYKELSKMDEKQKVHTRKRLLEYCKLDTYAMVKIYNYLKEKTK